MLVAFGENAIKTVDDLADCAIDDLAGWTERKDGETVRHAGRPGRLRSPPARSARLLIMAAPGQGRRHYRGRSRPPAGPASQSRRPRPPPSSCNKRMRWGAMHEPADDAITDLGPHRNAAATEPQCIATREGAPDRGNDPVRGRARPGRRARSQAQAPGPRRLGHGPAARARQGGEAPRIRPAPESRRQGPARPAATAGQAYGTRGLGHGDRPQGDARSCSATPGRAAVASGPAVALITGPDRRGRCRAQDSRRDRAPGGPPYRGKIVEAFTSAQLHLALGATSGTPALLTGRASDTVLARWQSLEPFRQDDPGDGTSTPKTTE